MKCYAIVNVFGYPLMDTCCEDDDPQWHNIAEGIESSSCQQDQKECSHHKAMYCPFDAWVEEVRSELQAKE